MFPAGYVYDEIMEAVAGWKGNDEKKEYVWKLINGELTKLCQRYAWDDLRPARLTIDFSDMTDETGMWLPSNLAGIEHIVDEDDEPYMARADRDIDLRRFGYRYYTYRPNETPMVSGSDLVIENGGTTISAASITASHVGYYLKIADYPGYYEIEDATTISPTYYGPTLYNAEYQVRPMETRKLVCLDPDSDVVTDKEVYVYYWKLPTQVFRVEDMIPLPSADVLTLRVLRKLPEAKAHRPVSKSMMDEALEEALAMNPESPAPIIPKDRYGQSFSLKNAGDMWSSRVGGGQTLKLVY